MKISYIAIKSKIYPVTKKNQNYDPLYFGCTKTVNHSFSETGFYLKYKSCFLARKHQIVLKNIRRLTPTAIIRSDRISRHRTNVRVYVCMYVCMYPKTPI